MVDLENFKVSKASSKFLYEVMEKYGGREKFYDDFYLTFLCPLGIEREQSNLKRVNANYYENNKLKNSLKSFILQTLKEQIKFNIDTRVCYCIGSGENYKFLQELNAEYNFFEEIKPLEHPRYITQYNNNRKDEFLNKYVKEFKKAKKGL